MKNGPILRIGTRGSPLARYQAELVRAMLASENRIAPEEIEIVAIRTSGDAVRDRPLADVGGKGLFTKEIEEALLDGRVDVAVHSAKDVPTFLPDGLTLAAYPEREDPRDAFVSGIVDSIAALPRGAVVGSASVRREALIRRMRDDIDVKLLRGNVHTRLEKVANGTFAGSVLAIAGLKRLGLEGQARELLDPTIFPPSVGQGAIAVEIRADDAATAARVAKIDHAPTSIALAAERAFLAELDGSCRAPIAGHARIEDGRVDFYGLLISVDGREFVETRREGAAADATALGADAGQELKRRASAALRAVLT
ncbi:MAG TPA: hydroxymethylbilane synthase [Xanthobacteraceae bacterium]|nr:hydroxymethylbilane synthase [Xanthobacteraceae bacterium]